MESRSTGRLALRMQLGGMLLATVAACAPSPRIIPQNESAGNPPRVAPALPALPSELRADVVIAIDTSGSTAEPTGLDIDGDGMTGVNPKLELLPRGQYADDVANTDPDDSILAAELQGVRALLGALAQSDVRVAIVSFAGNPDPITWLQHGDPANNAHVLAPLGAIATTAAAIDEIEENGSYGGTDFSAAIAKAGRLLCADRRDGAARILLLVTDGTPSLPFGRSTESDPADTEAAIDAVTEITACDGRIHVFSIGPAALGDPIAARAVARASNGSAHGIRKPGELATKLRSALVAP